MNKLAHLHAIWEKKKTKKSQCQGGENVIFHILVFTCYPIGHHDGKFPHYSKTGTYGQQCELWFTGSNLCLNFIAITTCQKYASRIV